MARLEWLSDFCSKRLEAEVVIPSLLKGSSLKEILKASIGSENSTRDFYLKAAELAKDLLANVPGTILGVAKLMTSRIERLNIIIESRKGKK